ncbi:MAG: hypothetical protein ABI597_00420 [Gammaproteobacteria bacterium]
MQSQSSSLVQRIKLHTSQAKRKKAFVSNQEAIKNISAGKGIKTKIGYLSISHPLQDTLVSLIDTPSFAIVTNQIKLPDSLRGTTLQDTIKELCDKYLINIEIT